MSGVFFHPVPRDIMRLSLSFTSCFGASLVLVLF